MNAYAVSVIGGRRCLIRPGQNGPLKNVGSVPGAELGTYVVEKGKPLVVIVK